MPFGLRLLHVLAKLARKKLAVVLLGFY